MGLLPPIVWVLVVEVCIVVGVGIEEWILEVGKEDIGSVVY